MGAGVLFGRGPQEGESRGCVLRGRKPIKGVLLNCGHLVLGAFGTL